MVLKQLILLSLSFSQVSAQSWFNKSDAGWHWYKDPKVVQPPKSAPAMNSQGPSTKQDKTYTEQLDDFKKRLEEAQARAVLNPTLENVAAFIRLHDAIFAQASKFQEAWQQVTLMNPDPELLSYNTPKSKEIYLQKRKLWLDKRLKGVAQDHGLFFVFKSGCRFCHEFAPVVRRFANRYGFEVKAISTDGGSLPEFPEAVMDNGTAALINPEGIYPALFVVNPRDNMVQPVAWGMVNEDQLKENFQHWLTYKGGKQ